MALMPRLISKNCGCLRSESGFKSHVAREEVVVHRRPEVQSVLSVGSPLLAVDLKNKLSF